MPKNLIQNIIFTALMALFMVYGMIVYNTCIMCPVMSLIAKLLFKEPDFETWVQTFGMNLPCALLWQLCYCGPAVRFIFSKMFPDKEAVHERKAKV